MADILDFDDKPYDAADNFAVNAYVLISSKYPPGVTVSSAVVTISVDSDGEEDASPDAMISGNSPGVNADVVRFPNGSAVPAGYIAAIKVNAGVGVIGAIYILKYVLTLSTGGLIEVVRGRFKLVS